MVIDWLYFLSADISSYQAFFNFVDMRALLENFCVFHVNAPGQEEGAPAFPEEWVPAVFTYILPNLSNFPFQISY